LIIIRLGASETCASRGQRKTLGRPILAAGHKLGEKLDAILGDDADSGELLELRV
jgi:hypothetical protein